MKRRAFLKSTAIVSGISILKPAIVFGTKNNSSVRVGFIGTGNRGTACITSMATHNDVHIISLADLFQDKLDLATKNLSEVNVKKGFAKIDSNYIYQGSKAYLKLLERKDIDAVQISTPAYAHPMILESAVAAGKHVYCEKPAGTDVYGCRRIIKTGKSLSKNLTATLGFQVRYATPYAQMAERIQRGDIGDIVSVQLYYFSSTNPLVNTDGKSDDEKRIRNHFYFNEISGGIYLDKAIHMIDICNLVLGATPLYAVGMGGDKGHRNMGNAWTNYQVLYKYPNNINVSVQSTKLGDYFGDVCAKFVGTKGIAQAHYSGGVFIIGDNPWDSGVNRSGAALTPEQIAAGTSNSSLDDADVKKGKSFIDSIVSGNHLNLLQSGAESTLSAILGRQAAIKEKAVYWDKMLSESARIDPKLNLTQFDKG